VDQKAYWGLGEIVMWIRTGDHERVAAMSDLSEEDAMALAMFTDTARLSETEAMVLAVFLDKARLEPRPLLGLTATNSDADREAGRRGATGNRRTSTGLSRCRRTKPWMTCTGKCTTIVFR